jgi:GT2 family glycosyltransferase
MRGNRAAGAASPVLRRLVRRFRPPAPGSIPLVRFVEIELAEPLPTIPVQGAPVVEVLVTLHGEPLGKLAVEVRDQPLSPSRLQESLDRAIGDQVKAHLHRDGIPEPASRLWAGGGASPPCLRDLEPGADAPLVSVVIPTHGRAAQLAACLDSVLATRYPAFEVIAVDNAPPDDSTQRMVADRFGAESRVTYLREERAGASLARNLGVQAARGEIVAFTDDDALVDPWWVSALVAGFADDPRVGCVTGLTLPIDLDTPAQQAFELYGGMTVGYQRRVYDLQEHRGDTALYPYTAGVFGASNNVAFRRGPFLERGGFDVSLGPATPAFGAEDLDAFLWVVLGGQRIRYEPRAVVRHEHRREFSELYWQVFTYSAGFVALLVKWALADRRVAADLARRVPRLLPAALLAAHRGGAEANIGDYPSELRWLERLGFLYGPVAYVRSRVWHRGLVRTAGGPRD